MAERTVNVNIRYNINTGEIQKAQAATQAAQKATDELRKAVEQYGKESVKANKDAAKATQDLSKEFRDLYSSVKLALSGGIAKEILDITLNMAKLSGQVEGVSRAFQRLPNATLLLESLRQSTHGTVTDLELMQKALQASNFRIPLENLGKLFEFAATKAQQTGQEVNHLIDYIVSGIGYRSIKRLDDLGFTANRVKEALGGVSLQAASMGQVMDAVTKLMDEDLQKTGGYAKTTATDVEQIETKWKSLRTTVSQIFTSPKVLEFIKTVVDLMDRGASVLAGKGTDRIVKDAAVLDAMNIKNRVLTAEILKDKQKTFDVVQQEANTLQQNIGRNNDELKILREKRDAITNSGRMMTYQELEQVDAINQQIEYYNFKNLTLKETIKILKEYNASLNIGTKEDQRQLGIIEAKRLEIEALQDQIETTTSMPQLKQLNRDLELAQAQLKELLSPLSDTAQKAVTDRNKGLTQTVEFDYKDPVTGEIKKVDVNAIIKSFEGLANLTKGKIPPINQPVEITPMDNIDKIGVMWEDQWRNILQQGIMDTNDFFMGIENSEIESYRNRLSNLRNFYDEQQLLAGDNERAKKELRLQEERETAKLQNEIALREWRAKRNSIILSTAGGIARAFIDYQWPYALIPAAAVAAQGGAQLAVADRNKPRFAKGVIDLKGPGSEVSDSIDAKLSRGESVMTARETREAFGILTDIRAGKLNDKVLRQIVNNGGSQAFDDSKIIDAIKSQPKPPDLVSQGRQIYEVYKGRDGSKRYIRSKSI